MLRAKAEAAGCVETNAGVDMAFPADQSRRHAASYTVLARSEFTNELTGCLNEIFVSHLESLLVLCLEA